MAKVLGESGAWRAVADQVSRLGHSVAHPEDVPALLERLQQGYRTSVEARRTETLNAVRQQEEEIARLESQPGTLRRLRNWWPIRRCRSRISVLHKAEASHVAALDRALEHVKLLAHSPELAGARAELAVIDHLRSLPDGHVVYNDVRLNSSRYRTYNGKPVQSAQVDHVVLGPGGVFVIETKCWSREFAHSGQGHSPVDQVGRASYLCYKLLEERYGKTKVRSIIASQGALPPGEQYKYVKVLRPEGLSRYIGTPRGPSLSATQIERLHRFFETRVSSCRPGGVIL